MKSVALKKKSEVTNEVNKLQLQIQIQESYAYGKKQGRGFVQEESSESENSKIEVTTCILRKLNVPIYSSFFNIFSFQR